MKTIRLPRSAAFVAIAVSVACSAGAAFAQADPPQPDLDADGVADRIDVCPRTPRGAPPVLDGCAAFEVFAAPPELWNRSRKLTGEALDKLRANEALAGSERQARRALRLHAAGLDQLRAGDPCGAVATQERFATKLDKVEKKIAARVAAVMRTAQRSDPPSEYGDTPEADIPVSMALVAQATFARAAASLRADLRPLGDLCTPGAAPLHTRSRIVSIDDSNHRVELEDGHVLSIAAKAQRKTISEGMILEISGLDFGDGTGVMVDVGSDEVSAKPGNLAFECLHFRIAPIQPFPPSSNGPWITHNPLAYDYADAAWPAPQLLLEVGQRLAVTDGGCPGTTPDAQGQYTRYSAKIDASYYSESGPKNVTLASDLREDDAPVPFAEDLYEYASDVSLTVTVRKQTCSIFVLQGTPNCSAVEQVRVEKWSTSTRPTGFMCDLEYDKTEFAVDDSSLDAFATATVTSAEPAFYLNGSPIGGNPTDLWFEAEGYGASGATWTWPNTVPVYVGTPFAIPNFAREFWQPFDPFALANTGMLEPAGLRFAKLHGKRAGHSFWYSCRPPQIARDVLAYCDDPSPNTYYRLPFEGGEPEWHLGQANNGSFTHKGKQAYAYDFGADAGTPVLAARGGVVAFVAKDNTQSCWDSNAEQCVNCTTPNGANQVIVEHEDGTTARYFHAPEDGVAVSEGDTVRRGDLLAVVGTTGCSTGNHLHFDVVGVDGGGQTIPVRFESAVEDHETCYNPKTDEPITSTNVQN